MNEFSDAQARGINALFALQLETGEFPSFWSEDTDISAMNYAQSPFVTALVLDFLLPIDMDEIGPNSSSWERALQFIASWRTDAGLVHFLCEGIDPDLDDIALVHHVLQRAGFGGIDYLSIAKRIGQRAEPDGRFETWIRARPAQLNDIDPCVCVNVCRYLCANKVTPNYDWLVVSLRQWRGGKDTLYYVAPYFLPWLASCLPEKLTNELFPAAGFGSRAVETQSHHGLLDAALRVLVGCKVKADRELIQQLAQQLLKAQRANGEWPTVAAFQAFNYWGSPALTTAVCLRAIYEAIIYQSPRGAEM